MTVPTEGPCSKKDLQEEGPCSKKDLQEEGPCSKKDLQEEGPCSTKVLQEEGPSVRQHLFACCRRQTVSQTEARRCRGVRCRLQ